MDSSSNTPLMQRVSCTNLDLLPEIDLYFSEPVTAKLVNWLIGFSTLQPVPAYTVGSGINLFCFLSKTELSRVMPILLFFDTIRQVSIC